MADDRIVHVVVLMLENRSFDHMLGYLHQGHLPALSIRDGVPADPTAPHSGFVPVTWSPPDFDVSVDPGHGYCDVMRQLTGTRGDENGQWRSPYTLQNTGFVWNYADRCKPTPVRLSGRWSSTSGDP